MRRNSAPTEGKFRRADKTGGRGSGDGRGMSRRCGVGYVLSFTANTLISALMLAAGGRGQERERAPTPAPSKILISDVRLARSTRLAVRMASERVAAPGCHDLVSEFLDQRGRPLAAQLAALRMSLGEYLHIVYFLDGAGLPSCAWDTVAVTTPGSRVVYLCRSFTRESPSEAATTVIHEVLHSLGLGENPPSPLSISNRVRTQCRRPRRGCTFPASFRRPP